MKWYHGESEKVGIDKMANYGSEKKEHAFNLFGKDIKEGSISKPLIFYGKEKYLINWAIDLIIKKYINPHSKEMDLSILEETDCTLDVIKATCETYAMFSEKRVVVLKDFKDFNHDFISYLAEIPDSCQLILVCGELDKKGKTYKEASKFWMEYDFDSLSEVDLKKFIEKRLKAADKTIKGSLISQMISSTGYYDKDSNYNLYNLENDIKKIIFHSQGDEIELTDVLSSISGNVETNVYQMIDAISSNKKDEAFVLLHNILTSGENLYYILAIIIGQFETILEVKELREEGHGLNQIQKVLGIHEFRVKKAMGFGEKFSKNNVIQTLENLYEVDRNIKNGFIDGTLGLEMIIARI